MIQDLADVICHALENNERIVLATVIHRQGSSPRSTGAGMAVLPSGRIHGTIGGGLLEARVADKALEIMHEARPLVMSFDLSNEDVAGTAMICGGRVDVLLDPLAADQDALSVFPGWREADTRQETAFLITSLVRDSDGFGPAAHALVYENGTRIGYFPYGPDVLAECLSMARDARCPIVRTREDGLVLVEPAGRFKTAFLIGAGHVSRPTAHLAALVGFRVVVLDDRAEYASRERFPEAHRIEVIRDYRQVLGGQRLDHDCFVVIVTRGHLHDKEALAQALRTQAGYIGMIGSRKKKAAIFQALLEEGFTPKDLERVHSPIGLDIGAETPEEIALSIVAEMIQVQARRDR